MNAPRLDSLVRSLGEAPSRRGLLGGLSATALALAATRLPIAVEAKKAKKKHKKKKKHKQQTPTPQTPATPATPVTKVDATCSGPNHEGFGEPNGDYRFAQTFTALASGPLVRAELPIYKVAGSGGAYILRLSPVDGAGVPTNTVLAWASVPNLSVPGDEDTTVTFTFANPAAVVAGTQYALVLTRPGSNQLMWVGHINSTCSGSIFFSDSQTAAFTADGGLDLIFTTFVTS